LLSRTISAAEYEKVLRLISDLGMENGWIQEIGASEDYVPDFERKGHPFVSTLKGQT
jgi:putative pyruvate formate lyase activating enzyme